MFLQDYARKRSGCKGSGGSLLANLISGAANIFRRIPTQDLIHGTIGTAATLAGAYGIKKAVDAAREKKEAENKARQAAGSGFY